MGNCSRQFALNTEFQKTSPLTTSEAFCVLCGFYIVSSESTVAKQPLLAYFELPPAGLCVQITMVSYVITTLKCSSVGLTIHLCKSTYNMLTCCLYIRITPFNYMVAAPVKKQ